MTRRHTGLCLLSIRTKNLARRLKIKKMADSHWGRGWEGEGVESACLFVAPGFNPSHVTQQAGQRVSESQQNTRVMSGITQNRPKRRD